MCQHSVSDTTDRVDQTYACTLIAIIAGACATKYMLQICEPRVQSDLARTLARVALTQQPLHHRLL